MNYEAYTIDGSLIFSATTAQELADKVYTYLEMGTKPRLGYTHKVGECFVVWTLQDGRLEGTSFPTFEAVADWWQVKR